MSTFYGSDLVQFPDQISYDPRTGRQVRRPWRGTPTKIVDKMNELILAGVRFDHEPGVTGGYQWVIAWYGSSATQPNNVPLSDLWSMPGNDLEKDVWRHPKVKALFSEFVDGNGFPTEEFFTRRTEIEDILNGDKTIADLDWWDGAPANMKKFVRNLARGETSYALPQYVVRNVKSVADNYTSFTDGAIPAYTFAGKILTTSELQIGFGVPAAVKFSMPAGYWLQRTPTLSPVPPDRWEIAQEWWHADDYDDFLYDRI